MWWGAVNSIPFEKQLKTIQKHVREYAKGDQNRLTQQAGDGKALGAEEMGQEPDIALEAEF